MTTKGEDSHCHRRTRTLSPKSPTPRGGVGSDSGSVCSNCGSEPENNFSSTGSGQNSSIGSRGGSPRSRGSTGPKTHSTPTTPTSPQTSGLPKERKTRTVAQRSASCIELHGNSRSARSGGGGSCVCVCRTANRKAPSLSSLSKKVTAVRPFSVSVDACPGSPTNGQMAERIHDFKECTKESPVLYLTPLQRKEREGKEMKKEISRLYNELSQKDERIYQLQLKLEEEARDFRDELDRRIAEVTDTMNDKDREMEITRREKTELEAELDKIAEMFTELKVKQKLQEDQFQERYLDMYKRGQKAAMFEREQELEMIATSKQPKVTVRELTRKLSITESELAKWQSLRLDETYKQSAEKPLTDSDVTLSFLRDSFFHFICDKDDRLRHFRAIVEIFQYSDAQRCNIREMLSESKDFRKLFRDNIS